MFQLGRPERESYKKLCLAIDPELKCVKAKIYGNQVVFYVVKCNEVKGAGRTAEKAWEVAYEGT